MSAEQLWADAEVPLVVLDAASVETHFLVQPLRWIKGMRESEGALWVPLASVPAELDRDRERAERIAQLSGLTLQWPKRDPRPAKRANRIAALASARARCAVAMHQMSGLAYGAGLDLEGRALGGDSEGSALGGDSEGSALGGDSEGSARGGDSEGSALGGDFADSFLPYIAERAGVPVEEMLQAATDGSSADRELAAIAERLAQIGITRAPALRWRGVIHQGHEQVSRIAAQSQSPQGARLL